jgi:hypothetical protein
MPTKPVSEMFDQAIDSWIGFVKKNAVEFTEPTAKA